MTATIFLCIMKSHPFAMFVWNFTTTSLSVAEILLFIIKMVENWRRQHCQLTRARNAYLRPSISTPAHCASAFT